MYCERNISALAEYFASGCKTERLFGVELEHFVTNRKTNLSLPYENGIDKILTRLQPLYGAPVFSEGRIIGITHTSTNPQTIGAEISLEPAAQLEISIEPTPCIEKIRNTYDEFLQTISPILYEFNCELICAGYQPRSKASELTLIPKKRYEHMHEFFTKTGKHGIHMMRGTAATQINIDYESEADFQKKFRVANIFSPIFSYMCDNAKVFENIPYLGRMLRAHIWSNVDPARAGIAPHACDGNFGFSDYAKYVYEMPPIFIIRDGKTIFTGNTPNSQIFANRALSQEDIEHITSMAFPDVRLKNRIEIRMADSMPIEKTLAFTALIKQIFYNEANLNALHAETIEIKTQDITDAKNALIQQGASAKIYNKPMAFWISVVKKFDSLHE